MAASKKAAKNVASAINDGDLKASLTLLKGIGALNGHPPNIGSDDPDVVREEARINEHQEKSDRFMKSISGIFSTGPIGDFDK